MIHHHLTINDDPKSLEIGTEIIVISRRRQTPHKDLVALDSTSISTATASTTASATAAATAAATTTSATWRK